MMAIIRWEPFLRPFDWERDMERFFEDWVSLFPEKFSGFVPAMNIYQTKDNVVVETSLPGVKPEDVDISIENDVLTIKGKTEEKVEDEEKNYYRKEIRSGSFYRTVSLPAHVEGKKAVATFKDGLLRIEIPKAPEEKGKRISIKVKGLKSGKSEEKKRKAKKK